MGIKQWIVEKLNPAQDDIRDVYGDTHDSPSSTTKSITSYEDMEVVQRGINLIVDAIATIQIDVGNKIHGLSILSEDIRKSKVEKLLNYQPNIFMNRNQFISDIVVDLLLDGNAFIHWDGGWLYILPAKNVEIVVDKKRFINKYTYNGKIDFSPNEIIWIKDNSENPFRGSSRLNSAQKSIEVLTNMNEFHRNFFKHGTLPGLILKTPNTLSERIKDRILKSWAQRYNAKNGGRRPMILDGEFEIDTLGTRDLRELDFVESIKLHENKVLTALGVPPILIDSGNNANINPNIRLFYLETILPLLEKILSGFERFYGYDLKPVKQNILALKPEMKDEANYFSTLVNAGILTRNEARAKLRLQDHDADFADDLILPANVAGSALDSGAGGNPGKDEE